MDVSNSFMFLGLLGVEVWGGGGIEDFNFPDDQLQAKIGFESR